MATLFNTRISDTYPGLIKTTDNAAISATLKQLSDGSGNLTGLYLNNAGDFKVTSILEFGSLKDTAENIVITKFVDSADGIPNNNNDTSIPTSKAVKDFVETHVTAQDLDFRGDDASVAGDVDLDSEAFIILGTANEIETTVTSAGGNTLQIGIVTNPALSGNVGIAGNIDFADNARARFGTSADGLEIYHDGSNSYIDETGTGSLYIKSAGAIRLQSDTGENMIYAQNDSAVNLYFNNVNRIQTTSTGANVTGDLTVTGSITGSGGSFLPLAGGTMTGNVIHNDNKKSIYGTSSDGLEIYHNGSNSFISDTGTGLLVLSTNQLQVYNAGISEFMITAVENGAVNLYYGGAKKLETSSTGVTITGRISGLTDPTQAQDAVTKSYVDNLDAASDLDFSGDSGTGDVTLNTQTFSVIGTANEVETTASNQQLQIGLPSSISVNSASATALQTARDISLTGQATATISGFDGSSDVSGAVTLDNNSVTGKVLTGLASPTASNILASDSILEAFGKTQSQLNTLAGGLRFMGTWNANTNTPTLQSGGGEADSGTTTGTATNKLIQSGQNFTSTVTNGDKVINQASGATALVTNVDSNTQLTLDADIMVSGQEYTIDNSPFITQGHYFVVSHGGTSSLNGLSNWAVGDWVIAGAGNVWEKLDHTQVDGTGTAGNIAKFSSTNVIADSIMAESGSVVTVTGGLTTTQNLISGGTGLFDDNVTIGSTGAGTDKSLFILTGGGESSVKLFEAGLLYGFSQVYDGTANQFFIKRHSNSASGVNVITLNRDDSNAEFSGYLILKSTSPVMYLNNTTAGAKTWYFSSAANGKLFITQESVIDAITLEHTTGNATFSGTIDSGTVTSTGIVKAATTFQSTAGSMTFFVPNHGQALEIAQNTGNATFSSSVGVGVSGGSNAKLEVASTSGEVFRADSNGGAYRLVVDQSGVNTQGVLNHAGNIIIHNTSNAPYIDFVESGATTDSKARITMDQVDTNNGTLLFATENAGTLYNQMKLTQTGNLLLSDDAANFNTSDAKINIVPTTSNVYQQWSYSPSNDNFSLKLKQTVTSGNVRYVFEQINNSTTYDNTLVLNQGKIGIGEVDPSFLIDLKKGYSSGDGKVAKFRAGNDATFVQFDTVQVVQQDVPCLAIIETSTGTQSDEQKLTLNVGDTRAVIGSSSTVTDGISFRVNRAVDAHGYAQTGTKILHLKNDGNAVFHQDITARIGNFKSPDATDSTLMNLMANNGNNAVTFRTTASGSVFKIQSQNSGEMEIESKILSLHHPTDNLAQFRVLRVEASSTYAYMSTVGGTAQFGGTGDARVRADGSSKLKLATNGSDRLTILSSGDVCVGTDSPSSNTNYGTGDLNVENDVFASAQIMSHNSTVGNYSFLGIGKSSGTGANPTIVQANETVGTIGFYGHDGNVYRKISSITSAIDGTPGAGDMPGKLVFATNSDGTTTTSTRMVINDTGDIEVKTGSILVEGTGKGIYLGGTGAANLLDDYEEGTWTPVIRDLAGNQASTSTATGTYRKIGDQIIANYDVRLSSKGSMTGNYVLLALPFTHAGSTCGTGIIDKFNDMATAFSSMTWDVTSTNTVAWLMGVEGTSATSSVYVTVAEIANNTKFKGTIIYHQ